MTTRKKQGDKLRLHQPESVPTWQDRIAPPPATKASSVATDQEKPTKVYKTYWIDPDIVNAVKEMADEHRVGINELVEFLLTHGITAVKENDLDLPVKSKRNRIAL
jgi:hypothetical protein